MGRSKTLAQQIAELDDPAPQDFDPEEDAPAQGSDEESGSDGSDDGLAGTEHYVDVGKSKLRKREEVALGPKYAGARISREALLEDDNESEIHSGDDDEEDDEDEPLSPAQNFADPEASDFEVDDEDGDINSDDALGESDDEKFKDFTFRGSGKPKTPVGKPKRATAADFMSDSEDEEEGVNGNVSAEDETDEDILDVEEQHAENSQDSELDSEVDEDMEDEGQSELDEQEDDDDDDSDSDSDSDEEEIDGGDEEAARRAELRKIMNEEQKTVVSTISQAAKADAEKGDAVKQQRKVFDSFLNVRIRLQKGLVATNSMAAVEEKDDEVSGEPYEKAQEAAIQLWNTLDTIRYQLSKANNPDSTDKKRKRIDVTTSSSKIWKRMKTSEVSFIDVRQTTLEKWSAKVKGATALPLTRKLNQPAPQQSITSVLQEQLASSEHLIKRTKMPRSCAPIQAKLKLTEDPNIYDDADFYQMLLKELVDQRMTDSGTAATGTDIRPMQWTAVKEAKTRKNVDTKASKGRKMKFTVHEKLQNFMAPDDRGGWEQDAIDRFFSTLLGQKVNLGEDEQGEEEDHDDGVPHEEEGLMLFRS